MHSSVQSYTRAGLPGNALRCCFCFLLLFSGMEPGFAEIFSLSSDDTVTITAEKAWEDGEADVIHFSGNFVLRAPDWYTAADSAVVYGKLDNPDKLVLEGKPARIFLLRDNDKNTSAADSEESVEGSASRIEYFRATNELKMRGAATLKRKDTVLVSEVIEYDVDADRYSASGEGGVNVRFNPED